MYQRDAVQKMDQDGVRSARSVGKIASKRTLERFDGSTERKFSVRIAIAFPTSQGLSMTLRPKSLHVSVSVKKKALDSYLTTCLATALPDLVKPQCFQNGVDMARP